MADFWIVKYKCGFFQEDNEIDYNIEYYPTKHEAMRAINAIRKWQKKKREEQPEWSKISHSKWCSGFDSAIVYPCTFCSANPKKLFEKFGFEG